MGAIDAIIATLRNEARSIVSGAADELFWKLAIAAVVLVIVVFALIGVFQALLLVWPAWAAAAAIAVGLTVLLLIAWAIRSARRRNAARAAAAASADRLAFTLEEAETLFGEAMKLTGDARDFAVGRYRRDPAGSLIAAVAVGAIVGMLDKPRRR